MPPVKGSGEQDIDLATRAEPSLACIKSLLLGSTLM